MEGCTLVFRNDATCMEKNWSYMYSVKLGLFLCNIIGFCKQNGVKCMKKYKFYRYPVKVGPLFVKKYWLFKQNCDFEGWGRGWGTDRQTHTDRHTQ